MNRKHSLFRRLLAVVMLVLVMAFSAQTTAKAGFGDFNDYDSSSDWDSSDSWDSDWGSSDYDSYSYSSDGDSSGGDITIEGIVICILGIIIYLVIANAKSKKKKGNDTTSSASTMQNQSHRSQSQTLAPEDRTEEISRQIKEYDPLFTAQDFLSFAGDVYMDIQSAWEKRDLTPVRAVLHQNLYQQTEKQIQKKIEDGIVNHLERISVNKSYLMSYHKDEKYEYLDVYLEASMIDYQVKEATGEILYGDKTTRWKMQYKMTFMRSVGSLTRDARDKEKGLVCPNCGAPLTGTSFGKCEYCGSIVTTGAYDWVLSAFTAIKK